MNKRKVDSAMQVVFISLIFIIIAILGSLNAKEIYLSLKLPHFSAKPYFFQVAWMVLYIFMIIATVLIELKSISGMYKKDALGTYWLQLILNCMWPYIFFSFRLYFIGFLWILLLIYFVFLVTVRYYKLVRLSGILFIPYFIWLIYAACLNFMISILN